MKQCAFIEIKRSSKLVTTNIADKFTGVPRFIIFYIKLSKQKGLMDAKLGPHAGQGNEKNHFTFYH